MPATGIQRERSRGVETTWHVVTKRLGEFDEWVARRGDPGEARRIAQGLVATGAFIAVRVQESTRGLEGGPQGTVNIWTWRYNILTEIVDCFRASQGNFKEVPPASPQDEWDEPG